MKKIGAASFPPPPNPSITHNSSATGNNSVRSLIASSIRQNASYEVYKEVGCVYSDGSTRRADIIIDRQKDKGVILDPTIRFEMHEQQPQEVPTYQFKQLSRAQKLRNTPEESESPSFTTIQKNR
ncbi:hypothetical protein ANN_22003 [Periplaneta americana]|uniref:Uncharacterized protein n=1 Tax=Periplaneta americana TaxID=6978 RepID=A0ABQ8S7F0_PERAM|nr:hypothetical protein ANN_22003 [Periplaneta americana]